MKIDDLTIGAHIQFSKGLGWINKNETYVVKAINQGTLKLSPIGLLSAIHVGDGVLKFASLVLDDSKLGADLRERFPGLIDGETNVNGAELIEYLSIRLNKG